MGVLWTHEMYVSCVRDLVGEEYEVLGEYVRNNRKVLMRHNNCGMDFEMRPNDFKRGRRCPHCFGNHKKTTEVFKQEVSELVGDEYTVLGEYINTDTHILMKHNKCGHEWGITPYKFLSGRRCSKCSNNRRKTTIQFKKEVLDLVGGEYSILSEYKNAHYKVTFRHNTEYCDYNEFKMAPTDFLHRGRRCPKCHRLRFRGENHPNYNPKLTDTDRERRDYSNGLLKVWRNRVYRRDDYTCQKCGRIGGDLNAHHLNSWDTHKEERYVVKNGVTLCVSCHLDFHKEYGFGNNTREQFNDYLEYKRCVS